MLSHASPHQDVTGIQCTFEPPLLNYPQRAKIPHPYFRLHPCPRKGCVLQEDLVRISPPDGGSPVFIRADLTAELVSKGVPIEQASTSKSKAEAHRAGRDSLDGVEDESEGSGSSSEKTPLLEGDHSSRLPGSNSQHEPDVSLCLPLHQIHIYSRKTTSWLPRLTILARFKSQGHVA